MSDFTKLETVLQQFTSLFAAEDRDDKAIGVTALKFQKVAAEIESSALGQTVSPRGLSGIISIVHLRYQIEELGRFICNGNTREVIRTTNATSLFLQTGDCNYN